MRETSEDDPKGLIYEAYAMEGVGAEEARSIFLDWALGLSEDRDQRAAIQTLLVRFGTAQPDHPMTTVLREALSPMANGPRRRGGWRSRPRSSDS